MRRILVLLFFLPLAAATAKETLEEAKPGSEAKKVSAIQAAFHGKVTKFKARRVAIEYDFTHEAALKDFIEINPFLEEPHGGFRIDDGVLVGAGVGALCLNATFEADVTVTFTANSRTPHDIGVTLLQPGLTDQFLLFSVADTFFSIKDRQTPRQHMITVVGARDSGGRAGETLFRYLNRAKEPSLKAGTDISLEMYKRGTKNRLVIGKTTLDAEDRYGKFPEVQPALFVLNSMMRVTKLKISGKLTEAWLEKHEIPWDPKEVDDDRGPNIKPPKTRNPADGKKSDGERGRGGRGAPTAGWGGSSGTGRLIREFSDTSREAKAREKSADKIEKDDVKKDEFRSLIDCLYKDDLTTRTLAIKVLKRVTGKTLGYHPKAPEKTREKAIRLWWKYLRDNRERFS